MGHNNVLGTLLDSTKRRNLSNDPFISLAEALTWIAFRDAMARDELRAQVEGNRLPNTDSRFRADDDVPEVPGTGHFLDRQSGLEQLTKAWSHLRAEVDRGHLKVRGRYTSKYTLADAQLSHVEDLKGGKIATFSQFDISTGGIRRLPLIREAITVGGVRHEPQYSSSVIWVGHPESYNREFESFGEDQRLADGYLLVEVERIGVLRVHPDDDKASVSPNRQLDREAIIRCAADMRMEQPGISKGSTAASIVADLPLNPKSGKPRDTRHIERIIAHLWEGGIQNPPR